MQLPDLFQQDINAYKHWQSAQASLLGKILLQNAFQQLAINYTLHDIKIGTKDRPFINEQIDFNISHSGDYVIVAISDFSKVGIDIEKHRILKMNVKRFLYCLKKNKKNCVKASILVEKYLKKVVVNN